MSNKISLENDNFEFEYEPSNSENDYSEEEKDLLKEVRKRNVKNVEKKQQLLAFDDESSDENEEEDEDDNIVLADSDIEGADDDHIDIPDAKAWGKQRKTYYNTDFIDQDYSTYNQREEEEALQEEEEAKAIQTRLAKQLDEADFFMDIPEIDDKTENKEKEEENIKTNLNYDLKDLSKREKLKLFHKDSPEYAGLVSDFILYSTESKDLLCPVLEYAQSQKTKLPLIDFVEMRNNIILSYCTNIAFYIYLKSKKIKIKNHPIAKRLAQSRKFLLQLQDRYEKIVKPQIEIILERINSGNHFKFEEEIETKDTSIVKNPFHKNIEGEKILSNDENENISEDEEAKEANDDIEDMDEEILNTNDDERRGITYQISKNKGLTPHRKKENRNPRVKHRSKFRKALIRRKGAVRTIRKENQRYGGEISGIKSTVIKAVKFKA